MLPDNEISTNPHTAPFIGGRADPRWSVTHDYETGGAALNDPSQGLEVQVWEAWINGNSEIWIAAPSVAAIKVIDDTDITEVSLTFDQNMQYCVAYVSTGIAKLKWYDNAVNAFVTTEFPGVITPRVSLDDKRDVATRGGWSDIVFAYLKDGALCVRNQRERYAVEYVLTADLGYLGLRRIGVASSVPPRMQFEFATDTPKLRHSAWANLAAPKITERAEISASWGAYKVRLVNNWLNVQTPTADLLLPLTGSYPDVCVKSDILYVCVYFANTVYLYTYDLADPEGILVELQAVSGNIGSVGIFGNDVVWAVQDAETVTIRALSSDFAVSTVLGTLDPEDELDAIGELPSGELGMRITRGGEFPILATGYKPIYVGNSPITMESNYDD